MNDYKIVNIKYPETFRPWIVYVLIEDTWVFSHTGCTLASTFTWTDTTASVTIVTRHEPYENLTDLTEEFFSSDSEWAIRLLST